MRMRIATVIACACVLLLSEPRDPTPQVNGQWAASDMNLNCKLVHMIATSLIRHMHMPFKRVCQLV